jgi:hypothetical protein
MHGLQVLRHQVRVPPRHLQGLLLPRGTDWRVQAVLPSLGPLGVVPLRGGSRSYAKDPLSARVLLFQPLSDFFRADITDHYAYANEIWIAKGEVPREHLPNHNFVPFFVVHSVPYIGSGQNSPSKCSGSS